MCSIHMASYMLCIIVSGGLAEFVLIVPGYQWLLGLTLDKEVADIDQFLYTKAQHKWDNHNFMQINT